jgi:endoglucanase
VGSSGGLAVRSLASIRAVLRIAWLLAVLGALAGVAILVSGCGGSSNDSHHEQTSSDPLSNLRLWVNPNTPAATQVSIWRTMGDRADAAAVQRIAAEPTASWLGGGLDPRAAAASVVRAAASRGAVAQLVLYNIPGRDCQSYSSGGARSSTSYLTWVSEVAAGIGSNQAIVLVEPDAIDQAADGCIPRDDVAARYRLLSRAVAILKSDPHAYVYLDAGNSDWLSQARIVGPLRASGIDRANGFALNVANFQTTSASIAYGQSLAHLLGGSHFVIDTSRNGNGPPPTSGVNRWCNPAGRALGNPPTTDTGYPLVDAFLWIKYPGDSDGNCHPGDPPAGAWWPAYALALARAGG